LSLDGLKLSLKMEGRLHQVNIEEETAYRINSGVLWTDITLFLGQGQETKADGLPNGDGTALAQALNEALTENRLRKNVAFVQAAHQTIDQWMGHKTNQEQAAIQARRWFTHEMQQAVVAARPSIDVNAIRTRLNHPAVAARLGSQVKGLEASLLAFETDPHPTWDALNAAHSQRELKDCKALLDRVESKPLTQEQALAVICFDNRVQVVASAGSGKTSTMVAKAAYAIHRGFVAPERIVLLAFNKQAAEELKERAAKSFQRLGMDGVAVEASTFHALGLSIIGKATGEKPDIPEWATDTVGSLRMLTTIIDQLKCSSPVFRVKWDLFRFVFGKDLPALGSPGTVDVWDAQGNTFLRTAQGELVKSQEEAMIANWLFYNGVEYVYEQSYEHRTVTADHRQYKPDFYYPSVDLYHEHFALDAHGQPPPHFQHYLEGVQWKRQLHSEKGTSLFETTSHGLRDGDDFQRLANELTSRGIVLDPNPDREIPKGGAEPLEPAKLTGLVRTFISHAKSNCLTSPLLHQRLNDMPTDTFKSRHRMFLDIVTPILQAWDAALAAEEGIDFEDMLNLAAEHLESGRYEAPYELVMADEFQDASRARARLCRALVQKPGRFLFAVGDDWQSINRFAGADVSVMTGFRQWFGQGQVLKLERTFRCPQELCDVSSQFVTKNPAQITKRVQSLTPSQGPVLQAFQVDKKEMLADAIDQFLVKLAADVQNGTVPPGRNGKVLVYVLGRYNADRQYVPMRQSRFNRLVDVSFLTIHRSKGSEADYVILPEMLSQARGRSFPDTRADDPVLALAMPHSDNYPLSEERRLFYVALTRARRSVAMFTVRGHSSSFLRELVEDGAVAITHTDGEAICEESCPACQQGVLILRTGPYGEFRSCSNYPACAYKPQKRGSTRRP
jgi:DNA helicase-4